jgi:hypothetical protein
MKEYFTYIKKIIIEPQINVETIAENFFDVKTQIQLLYY